MISTAGHMLPTTCHMPQATCLTPPGGWRCNSTSLWRVHEGAYSGEVGFSTVWRDNPFFTTTAPQVGSGLSYGG